jgi:hypothetical protein
MPTLDTIAPLPLPQTPKTDGIKPGAKSTVRAVRLVGIGVVVVVLCGAGAQYLRVAGRMPAATRRVSTMASRGLRVFGATAVNGLSWLTERVGLGRMVSGETSAVELPQSGATTLTHRTKAERMAGLFRERRVLRPRTRLRRLDRGRRRRQQALR